VVARHGPQATQLSGAGAGPSAASLAGDRGRYPFPMPGGPDDSAGGAPTQLSLWQRMLLALPRLGRDPDKAPLGERLRAAVLKPADPGQPAGAARPEHLSPAELEASLRAADDKERLVGLLGAPFAAAIGIIVINTLIHNDPVATLSGGRVNPRHVAVGTYHSVELILLVLAFGMMGAAWFRKRLILGILMALYGLAVFNLHYWGFGIPFLLAGSWLLVRSYRLQRDLREATGDLPGRAGAGRGAAGRGRAPANGSGPRPNKRYTPPPSRPKRPKPGDEKRAG